MVSDAADRARSALRRTADGLRGDGRGWVLLTVGAGWLVVLGLRFVVPALLPSIKAEFGINNTTAGAAITLIWVTYAAMQFPAGALVDRVGERTLLVGSTLVGGSAILLFSVVPAFGLFLLACGLFGLGTGLYGPARGTVLSRTYRDNDGVAFGVVLAAGSIGSAAMPFLATVVAARAGWRGALGAFVPALLVVGVGLWWAVPEREAGSGGRDRSLRRDARLIAGEVTRKPVLVAVGGAMLMLFVYQGLTAFFPTYLVAEKGLDERTAAALYTGVFLVGALVQAVAGGLADRFGHARVLAVVAGGSVLPLLALPFVDGLLPLAVVAALLGARMAIGPISNAYIIRVLSDDVVGASWGLLRTGFFTIGATGSLVVGALADAGLFDEAFVALAAVTGCAAVLYLLLPARESVV